MNFLEHAGKALLAAAGIEVPASRICHDPEEVATAAEALGPVMIKAQLPHGGRGMAGGVRAANNPAQAFAIAAEMLGNPLLDRPVSTLLVEARIPVAQSFYAAILNDPAAKAPLLLFAAEGGVAIETLVATRPEQIAHLPIDLRDGLDDELLLHIMVHLGLEPAKEALVEFCLKLYDAYRVNDAELLEVNPLALTTDGRLVALDCTFVLDDAALGRRESLARRGLAPSLTPLEARAHDAGLSFIELAGEVGVLANSAGLAMASMDAIRHFGGRPANYLSVGAAAYGLSETAFSLVLAHRQVKSLLVNFCGAYVRTDVLIEGLVEAWPRCRPRVPVIFSIHGTGEDRAVALVRDQLGMTPFDRMDDAVRAAVEAAQRPGPAP